MLSAPIELLGDRRLNKRMAPHSPRLLVKRAVQLRTGLPIFGFINSVSLIQFMINKDKIGD